MSNSLLILQHYLKTCCIEEKCYIDVNVCVCEREIDREIEGGEREDAERLAEQIFLHAWSGS